MTENEKRLLLIDLCARLPYGVKVKYKDSILELDYALYTSDTTIAFEKYPMIYFMDKIETIKPYLRPMSSMAEEEKKELNSILKFQYCSDDSCMCESTDWLNEHHLDYRGLIPMGLALEAPEGMYKTE